MNGEFNLAQDRSSITVTKFRDCYQISFDSLCISISLLQAENLKAALDTIMVNEVHVDHGAFPHITSK